MTGIARKDVRRVRSLGQNYLQDPRTHLSPLGDVLQAWCTNPDYLDEKGHPRPISYSGEQRSFEELVQLSGGDVPAGALKVELLRFGAVLETKDGYLRVVKREIVPEDLDERLFTSLAFSLKALATTIAHNTDPSRGESPRIERFVQSGPLTSSSRERLERMIRARIVNFTEEIDDFFSDGELSNQEDGRRIGVGVYFHEDLEQG